jgi:hypothetical protein
METSDSTSTDSQRMLVEQSELCEESTKMDANALAIHNSSTSSSPTLQGKKHATPSMVSDSTISRSNSVIRLADGSINQSSPTNGNSAWDAFSSTTNENTDTENDDESEGKTQSTTSSKKKGTSAKDRSKLRKGKWTVS